MSCRFKRRGKMGGVILNCVKWETPKKFAATVIVSDEQTGFFFSKL